MAARPGRLPVTPAPFAIVSAFGATASGGEGVYIATFGMEGTDSAGERRCRKDVAIAGRTLGPDLQDRNPEDRPQPRRRFIATDDADLGVVRSVDGGTTWQAVLGGHPGEEITGALGPIRGHPRALWVAAAEELWITRDDGATWRRQPPAPSTPWLSMPKRTCSMRPAR